MDSHGEDGGLLGGGNKPSNCIVEKDEKGDVKSSSWETESRNPIQMVFGFMAPIPLILISC